MRNNNSVSCLDFRMTYTENADWYWKRITNTTSSSWAIGVVSVSESVQSGSQESALPFISMSPVLFFRLAFRFLYFFESDLASLQLSSGSCALNLFAIICQICFFLFYVTYQLWELCVMIRMRNTDILCEKIYEQYLHYHICVYLPIVNILYVL